MQEDGQDDIERGWYHIRATARKACGAIQTVYSKSYNCKSKEDLRNARKDFTEALQRADFVSATITGTEKSKHRFYGHMIW